MDFEIKKRKKSKEKFSEKEICKILREVGNGILQLKKVDIFHNNVNPCGIVKTCDNVYKLNNLNNAEKKSLN